MVDRVGEMAGVILCGGGSRRMGRDKALLEVDGRPLVVAVAQRVAQVADPVMLAPGVPGRLGPTPFPEVADGLSGSGPLGGMAAGIAASPHQLTAIVAVDMPHASAAVLRFLADVVVAADVDAAIPVTSDGEQYLHAVYARSALPHISIALAASRLTVQDAVGHMRVQFVDQGEWGRVEPSARFAANVNTPEDVAAL